MTLTPLPQSLDDIDRTWVQSILTDPDLLTHDMPSFTLEPLDAQCSTLARMVLGGDLTGSPFPRSMILKLCPDGHAFLGASEPNYYCRDYVTLAHAPLVQCHGLAAPDLATPESLGAGYALVLEDPMVRAPLPGSHYPSRHPATNQRHVLRIGQGDGAKMPETAATARAGLRRDLLDLGWTVSDALDVLPRSGGRA